MAVALPEFPPFEVDNLINAGPRWKNWISRFEVLLLAMNVSSSDAEKVHKKALLMHYMCAASFDIYDTVKEDNDEYKYVKDKMDTYFIPKNNSEFERHLFRKVYQKEGETRPYCTRLRQLSINCDFPSNTCNQEIKMQMVEGVRSLKLRIKGMGIPMTLDEFMELGKTIELSRRQSKLVEEHLQDIREQECHNLHYMWLAMLNHMDHISPVQCTDVDAIVEEVMVDVAGKQMCTMNRVHHQNVLQMWWFIPT